MKYKDSFSLYTTKGLDRFCWNPYWGYTPQGVTLQGATTLTVAQEQIKNSLHSCWSQQVI